MFTTPEYLPVNVTSDGTSTGTNRGSIDEQIMEAAEKGIIPSVNKLRWTTIKNSLLMCLRNTSLMLLAVAGGSQGLLVSKTESVLSFIDKTSKMQLEYSTHGWEAYQTR